MSKSIPLSPKHGLNPTIPVCFFCKEEKNEIVLLGKISSKRGEDLEAPKHCILDYEPCEKCREQFSQGFLVIEVEDYPMSEGQPPIHDNHYPTGRVVLLKPNEDRPQGEVALCTSEVFNQVFGNLL